MSKLLELSEADKLFKESMVKLNAIKCNLDILDKEIYLLSNESINLEENINYLKQDNIIPLATEYKKIKQELLGLNTKIISLKNDRVVQIRMYQEAEFILLQNKEKLKKIQKSMENNVIKFRR